MLMQFLKMNYKIKLNKNLFFPKIQVHSVKYLENSKQNYNNNILRIRSILLDESENLKKKEKKIIFYFPFHQNFSSEFMRFDLKQNLESMSKKYETYNFVIIGSTSKKDIELFYLNNPYFRESLEYLIIDVLRLGDIQQYYGLKDILIVLDENGKVIYTNKNYILRNFVKLFFIGFLLVFNLVYIPTVDGLINSN